MEAPVLAIPEWTEVTLELPFSTRQTGEIGDSARHETCRSRGDAYGALVCGPSRNCISRHWI